MKVSQLFPASLASVMLMTGLTSLSAQDYMERYGERTVKVKQVVSGQQRDMELIGIIDGALEMKPPGDSPVVIATPLDQLSRISIIYEYPSQYTQARNRLLNREYDAAASILRQHAYPLIQYMRIPNENLNIHDMVHSLLDAVVNAGHTDEARQIITKLPLERLRPEFMLLAVRTAEQMIERGDGMEALSLLNRVPFDQSTAQFFPLFQRFAGSLREQNNYEEALFFYERLANQQNYARNAKLWIAYINVELNRIDTAREFLQQVGDIPRNDSEFSLKLLVQTKIALLENDFDTAKMTISQAVVFSDIGSEWSPELHFLDGKVYEMMENRRVARDVYLQVALLFPNSRWAEQSRQRVDELPPPAETSGDQGFSRAQEVSEEDGPSSQADALMGVN